MDKEFEEMYEKFQRDTKETSERLDKMEASLQRILTAINGDKR